MYNQPQLHQSPWPAQPRNLYRRPGGERVGEDAPDFCFNRFKRLIYCKVIRGHLDHVAFICTDLSNDRHRFAERIPRLFGDILRHNASCIAARRPCQIQEIPGPDGRGKPACRRKLGKRFWHHCTAQIRPPEEGAASL